MKKAVYFIIFGLILLSCHVTPDTSKLPEGSKLCSSDLDCPQSNYCGFVGVDTPAVCKYSLGYKHP